jgi:hypothetical protein
VLAQLDFTAGSLSEAETEAGDALKLEPSNRAAGALMRQIEAKKGR